MEFTSEKTNIAKGIAICLMFFNHLFAFRDRLLHGNYYIPLIPFIDIEFYIAKFGNVCVSMFLFLSGYGMFLGYSRSGQCSLQYSLKKLKDFYLTYWTYFLIFVPIGLIFFKATTLWYSNTTRYSTDWYVFLENFLGWSSQYDSEWWFVRMFVFLLIFLCPIYLSLAKYRPVLLCLVSISLFVFSWVIKIDYVDEYGFLFWQICFSIGIVCARFKIYSSCIAQQLDRRRGLCCLLGLFLFCIFFILRASFGPKLDFLFISIFIYFVIRIVDSFQLSKEIAYLGKYSFQLWLIHSFFCYYYFQDLIYFPRWSPLVFVTLTSTSLLSVLIIERLRKRLLIFKQ